MIPVPIAENAVHTLPVYISEHCKRLTCFFVENIREARRFLKSIDKNIDIDSLSFCEMNRNTIPDTMQLTQWLKNGIDVGVLSDSGCPGIADPGALLAETAQKIGAKVIPIVGPSSILLSLMASGLNGQSFAFNGYLPIKEPERSKRLKALEQLSGKENQTQIFIETPYRNNVILQDFLKCCSSNTQLCIAIDISGESESIITKTIAEWTITGITLPKQPAVFLVLAK
jgi:16S rRNA (cytidine1402-2'-O)-methyltransferase